MTKTTNKKPAMQAINILQVQSQMLSSSGSKRKKKKQTTL